MKPPYDPKQLAQRELATPGRYHLNSNEIGYHPSLWQRLVEWLYERASDVWKVLFGHIHVGNTGSLVISDIVLAAIAILVLFVLYRFFVNLQIEGSIRAENANTTLAARRSAHALYLQAVDLARRGEFSAAVRVLFLAAVTVLDLQGVVADDVSSTVGDVRRHLRENRGGLVAAFDGVAQPFVHAAYAEAPMDAIVWERASEAYHRLVRDVPRMKRSRFDLIALAAGITALVFLGFAQQAAKTRAQPSSFSSYDTGPNGYRALYEVLSQERAPVERVERTIGSMQDSSVTGEAPVGTLVISAAEPELAYQTAINPLLDRADLQQLKRDVRSGLHVVFLDDPQFAQFMQNVPKTFAVNGHASAISGIVPSSVSVAMYRSGKGVITLINNARVFSNANIAQGNNARFAYELLAGNGPVGFYERIHGYAVDKSFWQALPTPVHAAVFIAAGIVLLGLIGANIRFAPPVPVEPPDERDSSAYLTGMASLLRRSRSTNASVSAPALDKSIELSWVLAGTRGGDAALVRAAILNARLRKDDA